ncbi:MAG: hypothetical protein Q4G09_07120 [Clostridia bacterium]|nr:hypothetical protein [Clostridia bacterium]
MKHIYNNTSMLKGIRIIMNNSKIQTKENKLEFNTYCIFTEDKKDVSETIGQIFKDFIDIKNKKM